MLTEVRCRGYLLNSAPCNRFLGYVDGEYKIKCKTCKTMNHGVTNGKEKDTAEYKSKRYNPVTGE